MILNNTNISRDKCTFLDLKISIYRGKFLHSSYDKRDDFDFKIVNFPNLSGNIHTLPAYGVYISQLVRFCEINISFKGFANDIHKLNQKLLKQNFKNDLLKKNFKIFSQKYICLWGKYNKDIKEIL